MRIKTITCHKVNNHGANLQAYALMHYMEKRGHEVEIIDYYPQYLRHFHPFACDTPQYKSNILLKPAYICVKFPGRLTCYLKYKLSKRKKNFEAFRKKYYKVTKEYRSYEKLKEEPPVAELYIAGSDQIWNTMMENGKDPSFYLQFAPVDAVCATYAASFSVSEITENLKDIVKSRIEKLDFVAVRERSAINILEDLGITKGQVVLDPVFLLSKEEWIEIENPSVLSVPYLLVYDFEKSESIRTLALKYAKDYGLEIYSLYDCDYCKRSFENEGPDTFLSLVHHAEFVISNSFHATAFSIIYEKEFFVVERKEGINSRMVDLLKVLGLETRIQKELNAVEKINYTEVKERLVSQIKSSKKYLEDLMEYCSKRGERSE